MHSHRYHAGAAAIDYVRTQDPYCHAKLIGMLHAYDRCYAATQGGETPVKEAELWKLLKGTRFHIGGKLDTLLESQFLNGAYIEIVDHKTSAYTLEPSSTYWKQLDVDTQGRHYQALLHLHGYTVTDVVWDAITKPSIRPRQSEEPEAYAERVTQWYAEKEYDNTIVRRSVSSTQEEVEEYLQGLYHESRDILHARRTKWWRKNPQACMTYNTPCAYLGICSGYDTPDSDNWERGDKHPELERAPKRDLLTHSRMSCFRLCPRKHYYRYELAIKRREEVASEALTFGTLWHEAMDAWWTATTPTPTEV